MEHVVKVVLLIIVVPGAFPVGCRRNYTIFHCGLIIESAPRKLVAELELKFPLVVSLVLRGS